MAALDEDDADTIRRKQTPGATDRGAKPPPAPPAAPPPAEAAPPSQEELTPGAPPTLKGIPKRSGETLILKPGAAPWIPPDLPEPTHKAPHGPGPKPAAPGAGRPDGGTLDMAPPGFATAAVRHIADGGDTFARAPLTPEEQARLNRGGTFGHIDDQALTRRKDSGGVGAESGGMAFAVTQPRSRAGPAGIPSTAGGGGGKGELPKPGERLGKYEIVRELARGGMGVVYLAKDVLLKRSVALKVMLDSGDETDRRRFLREAESAGRLQHPNVCAVYDSGEDARRCYFTMEFVDGSALNKFVKQGHLEVRKILELFLKVCEGVGYAHMHGVIHRDLKPPNIFVDARGEPKVMDFGIAKQLGAADIEQSQITVHGSVMGTPSYMSPEQASGLASEIDIRSDVYTLGVILFELLCEQLPFKGQTITQILLAVCQEEPPLPRRLRTDLDWEVEAIVLHTLQKRKEARYQSCFELKEDIESYLGGRPIKASKAGALYKLSKLVQRNKGAFAGVGVALLAVLATVIWLGVESRARAGEKRERVGGLFANGKAQRKVADDVLADPSRDPASAREPATLARERFRDVIGLEPGNVEAVRLEAEAQALVEDVDRRSKEHAAMSAAARAKEAQESEAAAEVVETMKLLSALEFGSVTSPALADAAAESIRALEKRIFGAMGKHAGVPRREEALQLVMKKGGELDGRRAPLDRVVAIERRLEAAADELARARSLAAVSTPTAEQVEEADTRFHAAIEHSSRALELDGGHGAARSLRIESAASYAQVSIARGQLDLASYVVQGFASLETGERRRAPALLSTIEKAKRDVKALAVELDAGQAALLFGRYKEADTHFQKALGIDGESGLARFGVAVAGGRMLAEQDEVVRSLAKLAEAARIAPEPRFKEIAEREAMTIRKGAITRAVTAAEAALSRGDDAGALKALAPVLAFAKDDEQVAALQSRASGQRAARPGFVYVAAGPYPFGREVDAKDIPVRAFYIGRTEVTNAEFAAFVADGGYAKDELWPAGSKERRAGLVDQAGAPGPAAWSGGNVSADDGRRPVTGVCYHEALAYARSQGARLPTEVEWERAVCWDPATRRKTPLPEPWEAFQEVFQLEAPRFVESGAPEDRSPSGVRDGFANVQEWCAGADKDAKEARPVVRGGFFAAQTKERASATESRPRDPWVRMPVVGFRLARDAE